MAKVILNTNLINDTYLVEYKNLNVVKGKKLPTSAEVVITPKDKYVVDAVNFSYGLLPEEISDIKFQNTNKTVNSKNKVIAKIYFNSIAVKKDHTVIFLPISGSSVLSINEFRLVEKLRLNNQVFIEESNDHQVEIALNGNTKTITHSVKGVPNKKVKILSRKFTLPNDYHFTKRPFFNITGQRQLYSAVSNELRDKSNNIIGRTIDLYYTFPNVEFKGILKDIISFDYSFQKIPKTISKQLQEEVKQKIYGIDTGSKMSASGGEKRISIKGIPGSTFRLIVQNNAKEIYNFETGLFSTGAVAFQGVIPPALKGVTFGEIKKIIEVPANTGTSESVITTSLISDDSVDHAKIRSNYDSTVASEAIDIERVSPVEDKVKQLGKVKLKVLDGGDNSWQIYRTLFKDDVSTVVPFKFDGIEYLQDGSYELGPSEGSPAGSSIEEAISNSPFRTIYGESKSITFLVHCPDDGALIRVVKLPVFDQAQDYLRWDSAYSGEVNKKHNSAGTEIKMDWGTSVRHTVTSDTSDGTTVDFLKSKIKLDVGIEGIGGEALHGASTTGIDLGDNRDILDPLLGYQSLLLTIKIEGNFGEGEVIPELNLSNFLTLHSL